MLHVLEEALGAVAPSGTGVGRVRGRVFSLGWTSLILRVLKKFKASTLSDQAS